MLPRFALLVSHAVRNHEGTRYPQMVLAIESCHKLGFIHRDIKPDVSVLNSWKLRTILIFVILIELFV